MSGEFVWATVTAIAPLRVKLDGDTASLPFLPDALVDTAVLALDDRVRCERKDRRVIIHGRAGGGVRPASTTLAGVVELATDAETQAGTDTSRAVTPAALASLTATESRNGLVELATTAETQAGSDTSRAVTPAGIGAHNGIPHAMAAGVSTSSASAGGTSSPVAWNATTTVTLPVGRFSEPPVILTDAVAGSAVLWTSIAAETSTASFSYRVMRIGSTPGATPVRWIAIQMTPTSGGG